MPYFQSKSRRAKSSSKNPTTKPGVSISEQLSSQMSEFENIVNGHEEGSFSSSRSSNQSNGSDSIEVFELGDLKETVLNKMNSTMSHTSVLVGNQQVFGQNETASDK